MQFCFFKLGSCGFDSIPSDVGQMVVHQAMQGPVNTIETYLTCTTPPDEKGAVINFATWQSGEFLEITIRIQWICNEILPFFQQFMDLHMPMN